MSIKAMALELYRAQQEADRLQNALDNAELKDKESIRRQLKEAQAILARMRKMMDGAKENAKRTPSLIR
jgi:5-bromo-4-chloroindolyl phosphate hydrolysis protein